MDRNWLGTIVTTCSIPYWNLLKSVRKKRKDISFPLFSFSFPLLPSKHHSAHHEEAQEFMQGK